MVGGLLSATIPLEAPMLCDFTEQIMLTKINPIKTSLVTGVKKQRIGLGGQLMKYVLNMFQDTQVTFPVYIAKTFFPNLMQGVVLLPLVNAIHEALMYHQR